MDKAPAKSEALVNYYPIHTAITITTIITQIVLTVAEWILNVVSNLNKLESGKISPGQKKTPSKPPTSSTPKTQHLKRPKLENPKPPNQTH